MDKSIPGHLTRGMEERMRRGVVVTAPVQDGPTAFAIGRLRPAEYRPVPQGQSLLQVPDLRDTMLDMKKKVHDEIVVDIANMRGSRNKSVQQPETENQEFKVSPTETQIPDSEDMLVINRKKAKKKVEELPDKCEERVENHQLCAQIGVHHKLAQKRPLDHEENSDERATSGSSLGVPNKKETHDLLMKINRNIDAKRNKEIEMEGFIYQPKMLSDIGSLQEDQNSPKSKGSFGEVVKVYDVNTKQKLVRKKVLGKVDYNEIEVPLEFPHAKQLAGVVGLFYDGIKTLIIQEDAGLSLRTIVQIPDLRPDADKVDKIALHIFKGLKILHQHGIVHCDIKPENICLNIDTGIAKLVDFGSSKTSQDEMTYTGLTPEYLPPKFCQFLIQKIKTVFPRIDGKDDVWSAGLVVVFLFHQAHPMIQFFTGKGDYSKDEKLSILEQRMSVCRKISKMENPLPDYFIQPCHASFLLQEVLLNVLQVEKDNQWTAAKVVEYMQEGLFFDGQPKKKMTKTGHHNQVVMESQEAMTGDNEVKAEGVLRMRTTGQVQGKATLPAQAKQQTGVEQYSDVDRNGGRTRRRVCLAEDDLDMDKLSVSGQQMDKKYPMAFTQPERATVPMFPPKFNPPGYGNTPPSATPAVQQMSRGWWKPQQSNPWVTQAEDDDDNDELDKLIQSFQQTPRTSSAGQGQGFSYAGLAQMSISSQPKEVEQPPPTPVIALNSPDFNTNVVQEPQWFQDVRGFTGRYIQASGSSTEGERDRTGNVPQLAALMSQEADEEFGAVRPKIRAIRRGRCSKD